MLVLSRYVGESILIDEQIEISIVSIKGEQARIGINAPSSVTILRKEIYQSIQKQNQAALQSEFSPFSNLPTDFEE